MVFVGCVRVAMLLFTIIVSGYHYTNRNIHSNNNNTTITNNSFINDNDNNNDTSNNNNGNDDDNNNTSNNHTTTTTTTTSSPVWLFTGPTHPLTHWYQVGDFIGI